MSELTRNEYAITRGSRTSDANQSVVASTLHAYNAQKVRSELWNADMLDRDSLGSLAKFVAPYGRQRKGLHGHIFCAAQYLWADAGHSEPSSRDPGEQTHEHRHYQTSAAGI